MSVTDRIKPLTEWTPYRKVLLYGDPGVGKTVFAARAPGALIIDSERGTLSLFNHPELHTIPVLQLKTYKELEELYLELKSGAMPEVETLVFDSVSELQKMHLDEHMKMASANNENKNRYVPAQQDYNYNTNYLRRLIIDYADLERNIVFTAHVIEDKDESTGAIVARPNLTPSLANALQRRMDVVGYLTMETDAKGEDKRKLQCKGSRRVWAKTRLALPSVIENPVIENIFKARRLTEAEVLAG